MKLMRAESEEGFVFESEWESFGDGSGDVEKDFVVKYKQLKWGLGFLMVFKERQRRLRRRRENGV